MELPDPITAIGEQLGNGGEVTPPAELFEAYDVYAAEVARLFVRPWLAVDHVSRLGADGDYFRVDVGTRSVVLTRDGDNCIHALRNACLHAGYRVCEDEGGRADHLFCVYHGWSYALDGRLTDPVLAPNQTDRSRYRLPHYAMQVRNGLILLDMTTLAPESPAIAPAEFAGLPAELADWSVAGRQRHQTTLNWKYLRRFLDASKGLVFGDDGNDGVVEFGPLSFVMLRASEAAMVRLIPRFPGNSDVEVIRLAPQGAAAPADGTDRLAAGLHQTGESIAAAPLGWLDRGFYDWYWSILAPPEETA